MAYTKDCNCGSAPGQYEDAFDWHGDNCPVYLRGRIEELESGQVYSTLTFQIAKRNKRIAELEAILDSLLDGLECGEEWNGCGWCQICRAKRAGGEL